MNPLQIEQLKDAKAYSHPVKTITMQETHISWVLLTGDFAYKIKKPVNLGFVDYSTLALRKHYCEKELTLNQALASQLYLAVVPINETDNGLVIDGSGPVVEYALKMVEFSQEDLFDQVLKRNELSFSITDSLAKTIADFHDKAPIAPTDSAYGTPDCIYHPVQENFAQIRPFLSKKNDIDTLSELADWAAQAHQALTALFTERKQQGFTRACHGDLHLGNITFFAGKPIIFDCIEFNESFRWIDIISEMAFLVMDLVSQGRRDLGYHLLNTYLEITGDYIGLTLFNYYFAYKAMVRAKIQCFSMQAEKQTPAVHQALLANYHRYIDLAKSVIHHHTPTLFITVGISGSGKSTLAQCLVDHLHCIRLRSDVERARYAKAHNLSQDKQQGIAQGLYHPRVTRLIFQRLNALALACLQAGFDVIVDAAFLNKESRDAITQLASSHGYQTIILHCEVEKATAYERVTHRQHAIDNVSDATTDVIDWQIKSAQPLTETETKRSIFIDANQSFKPTQILQAINKIKERHKDKVI